jgi:hypothetical protein
MTVLNFLRKFVPYIPIAKARGFTAHSVNKALHDCIQMRRLYLAFQAAKTVSFQNERLNMLYPVISNARVLKTFNLLYK